MSAFGKPFLSHQLVQHVSLSAAQKHVLFAFNHHVSSQISCQRWPILNSLAVNGRNYFRDMLLAEAIPWPVVYDHRGSFGFHTHFPDHWPEQSHSVVRPFQPICVQVLGQVIRETGIVGAQVGGNGSSVIYPVWIE